MLLARPSLLPPAHQAAIADGDTANARNRVFLYEAYLVILNEGGEPL